MIPTCPLCGAADSTPWLSKGQWRYRSCAACSAVWLDPLPDDAWAADYYDRAYFEGGGRGGYRDYLADEAQHQANARARLALALRFGAAPPGLWIDVGCAAGYTLAEARGAGFEVCGVDVSPWARAVVRERLGLEAAASLSEVRCERRGQASVLTMFQVLEHLPAPLEALREAHACLRPGGLLVIETWDRASRAARFFGKRWQQITPPSVVWLFDRRSLEFALAQAGFGLRAMVPTAKVVSMGWAAGLLAEKAPGPLAPALARLADSRLGKLRINYRLGDLVTVAATADGNAAGRLFPSAGGVRTMSIAAMDRRITPLVPTASRRASSDRLGETIDRGWRPA